MRPRVPSGKAGRPWLVRRLEVARRGADVLEEKRRALLRERDRLAALAAEAEAEWTRAAREAERWATRAAVGSGERALELAAAHVRGLARLEVRRRRALGVSYPEVAEVELPPSPALVAPVAGAALVYAVDAHRAALQAAARHGAALLAHERVAAELHGTQRRLRAIERRWIPTHEAALAALELALDETERDEAARVRWIAERREGRSHLREREPQASPGRESARSTIPPPAPGANDGAWRSGRRPA